MHWKHQWQRIDERIASLLEVSAPYFASCSSQGCDFHGISSTSIIPSAKEVVEEVKLFNQTFGAILPVGAKNSIESFFRNFQNNKFQGISGAGSALVLLGIVRTEVSFYLKDLEQEIATRTEFAFIHLQRLMIADATVKEKWDRAFQSGEAALEKLGAAHLLFHKLWAFKAHAEGERTDLVVNDAIDEPSILRSGASLVLTEWKKATEKDAMSKADQAYSQAVRYGKGIFGGVELNSIRYVVLVSLTHVDLPHERVTEGIRYKFINVAIDPLPPSKARKSG